MRRKWLSKLLSVSLVLSMGLSSISVYAGEITETEEAEYLVEHEHTDVEGTPVDESIDDTVVESEVEEETASPETEEVVETAAESVVTGIEVRAVNTLAYSTDNNLYGFVTRMYSLVLGRTPDSRGYETWTNGLKNGTKTGASLIVGFYYSDEYKNKKTSDEDFVENCYTVILNRSSDRSGKASWVSALEAGASRTYVLSGFVGSSEFTNLCKSYGIERGSITKTEARDKNINTTKFVQRLYNICLGRTADTSGLNNWCKTLNNGTKNGADVIVGFYKSNEYYNKLSGNADFVESCYNTMLNRSSDSAGKAHWTAQLKSGADRITIIAGFVGSSEFSKICDTYGITKGSVSTTGHMHSYDSTTTAATCSTTGAVTIKCSKCGDVKSSTSIAKTDHNYVTTTVAATCSAEGSTTVKCSICGDIKSSTSITKTAHNYVTTTVAATCSTEGSTTVKCSTCGNIKSSTSIAKTAHNYVTVTVASTCKAEGSTTVKCSICGDVKSTTAIAKADHSYTTTTTAATCTATGKIVKKCSVCGDTQTTAIAATGHNYQVTTAATCTTAGTKTCTGCGGTQSIAAIGHNWKSVSNSDSSITETCSNCKESYTYWQYVVTLADGSTKTVEGYYDTETANEIINLLNAYRTENGLSALTVDSTLMEFAQVRSVEIFISFSHDRPSWNDYTSLRNNYGENITSGVGSASSAMTAWKNSSGHNSNMLSKWYIKVGVGVFMSRVSAGVYGRAGGVQIFY